MLAPPSRPPERRLLTRRQFARRLAAAAATMSLPAINPRAWAADAPPKRLVLMFSLGTDNTLWRPTSQPGAALALSAATQPLAKVAQHIMMVDGLSFFDPNNQHSTWQPFTGVTSSSSGSPGSPTSRRGQTVLSVDQYILSKQPATTRTPFLALGVEAVNEGLTFNAQRIAPNDSPADAFSTVFKGVSAGAGSAQPAANANLPRQAILDQVQSDIKELQSILGSEANHRLAQHLDALAQLEKNAAPLQTGGSCMPTSPAAIANPEDAASSTQVAQAQFNIIAQAFACDVTRLASFQWGVSNNQNVLPDGQTAVLEEHGGGVHAPNNTVIASCEATLARVFADFITTLAATPDPTGQGMLIDNTMVLWTRDMGFAQAHTMYAVPTVLAGAPAYLNLSAQGAYVRADGDDSQAKKSTTLHDAVLLNCLEWMGITDLSGFGMAAGASQPFAAVKKS